MGLQDNEEARDGQPGALFRELGRLKRAERRARMRQEIADGLRVVEAAKAAGLPIKAATIAGVALELGPPAASATLTPLEAWRAKHARRT